MDINDHIPYQKREFCNDIPCPVQLDLNKQVPGSPQYEEIRKICINNCRYTTYQFHHWLIQKGYLIVRPK